MNFPAPLEILLVTGPLGAGKTTVVNRLLRREIAASRRVAVLINEFGSVSVDGALVEGSRPELAGIENLVNGCACCSLRSEVVETLRTWADLQGSDRPERVVLETTGLADPTDLVDLEEAPEVQGLVRLAGCLTVVSALTPLEHLGKRLLLRHQVALASQIHVSKADLDPSLAVAWEGEIRTAYAGKIVVRTRQGEAPAGTPDPWQGDIPDRGSEAAFHATFAQARAISVLYDHPVDPVALEQLFQRPVAEGELLRAKGIVAFSGWAKRHDGSDRWAFQLADGRLEVTPLPALADGSLPSMAAVVIGLGLDGTHWKRELRGLERAPEGTRRKVVL